MRLYELLNELTFMGSECTKDCSGHRAGYAWAKRNKRKAASWSPSFNKGAALAFKPRPSKAKAVQRKLATSSAKAKQQLKSAGTPPTQPKGPIAPK
jgi:hypothetical protein